MNVDEKSFITIMDSDITCSICGKEAYCCEHAAALDTKLEGFKLLSKYTNQIIHGAGHDIIYSESVEVLIKAGITKEDVERLRFYGFHVEDEDYVARYA